LRDKLAALQQADSWGKRTLVRPTGSIGADIASLTSPKPRTPATTRTPTTPAAAAAAATPVTAARTPLASDKRALQKTVEQARELRDLQAQLQVLRLWLIT
jgi:hypothetical protein